MLTNEIDKSTPESDMQVGCSYLWLGGARKVMPPSYERRGDAVDFIEGVLKEFQCDALHVLLATRSCFFV
jgi:hypothetical protein